MPLFLLYFLSLFYHFFLSLRSFFTLSFLLLSCRGLLPIWSFLFLGTSLWVLTTFLPWVFPLKRFPPLGFPLSMFFSLPLFFPLPFGPLFLSWLPSFYSELIQWDFSLLPLRLRQLFLVCCGHPFKITHPPIGCPCHCSIHVCCTTTISRQNSLLFVPAVYLYLTS